MYCSGLASELFLQLEDVLRVHMGSSDVTCTRARMLLSPGRSFDDRILDFPMYAVRTVFLPCYAEPQLTSLMR